MKGFPQFCLFLLFSLSAFALDEGHARYVGGTVPGLTVGVTGRLDTTPTTSLTFEYAGSKIEIPYASIESYRYSTDVTRHLGVLPAIAVGLVKMRRHSHFFSISYRTESGGPAQIVVLEVPKDMPRTLQAILRTRAPQACCNYKNAQVPPKSAAILDGHPPLPSEAP
jgi:hypothetical protein